MRHSLFLLLSLVWAASLYAPGAAAQAKDDLRAEREAAQEAERYERGMDRAARTAGRAAGKSGQAGPYSFRNFVRGALATGNLIQVPYVNNVNISAGYWGGSVTPSRITWPKGSGIEYGHTMTFIAAAEVTADNGNVYHIVSESYNRSGGDRDPTGSHKYFYNPLPGYYNMRGAPGTTNRLNDNPDDRATINAAGYYFVGGLGEDANGNGRLDAGEDLNNNGQLDFELTNNIEYAAQSNLSETWPAFWPPQSYVGDARPPCDFLEGTPCNPEPGVRAGRWNGAYGSFVRGDQESYYVADDRDNDEYPYYPFLDPATGQPDTRTWAQGGRRGLGVEVSARQYQWASILAEDIFISTFDVKNASRKDIDKAVIAMIVDYDIAGQTGDNQALFDTKDDITYQWLKRDLVVNGFRIGYGGVGFLESPGIPGDGRDNDEDGLLDESRDDRIDNDGDWRPWVDVNGNDVFDNEDLNNNFILDAGEDADGDGVLLIEPLNDDVGSDGLGPENEDYPGPDPDGTEGNNAPDPGEPNFEFTDNDEIDQIGLTGMVIRTPSEFQDGIWDDEQWWNSFIQPGVFVLPTETADVIYVYSAGFGRIPRGLAQRFSIAFFCGNDFQDMLRNKRTMQNIYDSDYDFLRPPREPFLTAVPGDAKVTLVWDQSAELSRDPIYGFDFEMYKVYRSTDPEFNEIKTITDAFGNPLLWEPLTSATGDQVQFDLDNGLSGAHPVPIGDFGVSYDMGTDSGLQYSYVDSTVDNGRTYYYAVVSVDHGYHNSFYGLGISEFEDLAEVSPTESSKRIEVDAFDRPLNVGRNAAVVVPQAPALGYVEPRLTVAGVQQASGDGTGGVDVEFLVPDSANARGYTYEFTFTDDGSFQEYDSTFLENGITTGFTLRNVTTGQTLARVEPGALRPEEIFTSKSLRATLYDGMRFSLTNPVRPEVVRSEWLGNPGSNPRGTARPRTPVTVTSGGDNRAVPIDYEIRIGALGADTSNSISVVRRSPTNFSAWDVTDPNMPRRVPFQLEEPAVPLVPGDSVPGVLSPGDVLNMRVFGIQFGDYTFYARSTWRFTVGLTEQAQNQIAAVSEGANAFYDSLATYQVRGLERRPFGPDLEVPDLVPFFESVGAWYDAVLDSLATIPGVQAALGGVPAPDDALALFDTIYRNEVPVAGDRFLLETSKPFDRDDVIRFTVEGNQMEDAIPESALDDIYVVPDPYVAVNTLESRNILLSGRGERRIDFRNLPRECTIRIFTASGRQVKVIEHSAAVEQSIASWNLQSDDGLDVSFGVYIYHVDAPGIGEKIGRFAIIK